MRTSRQTVIHASPSSPFRLKMIGVVLFVFAVLAAQVALQVFILSAERTLHELRVERSLLEGELKKLEMEVVDMKKAGRIRKIAHEQLGMVYPDGPPEVLY